MQSDLYMFVNTGGGPVQDSYVVDSHDFILQGQCRDYVDIRQSNDFRSRNEKQIMRFVYMISLGSNIGDISCNEVIVQPSSLSALPSSSLSNRSYYNIDNKDSGSSFFTLLSRYKVVLLLCEEAVDETSAHLAALAGITLVS